jgi:HKD family nuclease
MLVNNLHGNLLSNRLKQAFASSTKISIACGYVTSSGLRLFQTEIDQHIRYGRIFRLVLGMPFFEGWREEDHSLLSQLDQRLRDNDLGGIRIATLNRYHGKIYIFENEGDHRIFIGSSNLSPAGMVRNTECNVVVRGNLSESMVHDAATFFETLYGDSFSADFSEVSSDVPLIAQTPRRGTGQVIPRGGISPVVAPSGSPLRRIAMPISVYARSGLNWNFGAGRPRSWYEAYIPVPRSIQQSGFFPSSGTSFRVTTDDGWQFNCKVAGAGGKNLESTPSLDTLGKWLKENKLGSAGLSVGQQVTVAHLNAYGKNFIEITKLSSSEYYFDY